MPAPWQEYQEQVAAFFRELGLDAATDVTIQGVRTSHDVDVAVRSQHVGFDLLWIVECKYWRTRVSKAQVLALRQIVIDSGADRGILAAEAGFQAGAKEAAALTNVELTSLNTLKSTSAYSIGMARLRMAEVYLRDLRSRYWKLPKQTRIAVGLRPNVGEYGYSANRAIEVAEFALHEAFCGRFPISYDDPGSRILCDRKMRILATTPVELDDELASRFAQLDRLLNEAEAGLNRRH